MKALEPTIVVLGGGASAERSVSLASSRAVFEALDGKRPVRWLDLTEDALPAGLDPAREVIFPVLHGGYGEGGALQAALAEAGFVFVGCDAEGSACCLDKRAAKDAVAALGVPVLSGDYFTAPDFPEAERLWRSLGSGPMVVKPRSEGSSVGLYFAESESALAEVLAALPAGDWMVEPKVQGHDVTVGVLHGEALGVVSIRPNDGGAYDFAHKYTAGQTTYLAPAPFPEEWTERLRRDAALAFEACGCRDFARVDFFFHEGSFVFLEINTIPGLTATSLLPMSARCLGYDFPSLVEAMLTPALARFAERSRPA